MKLFAFRGKQDNFGDELNHWLWDRLLPGFLDEDESELFLGIGSILHFPFDPSVRKVVFGSGFGGYGTPPHLDDKWTVHFVRGKETAKALGIDEGHGIGDAGILVRSCWNAADHDKIHDVSFMPHYESAIRGNWDDACARAGVHLIDPRRPVEEVLRKMSQSRLVVSEAMHGVIIADALRVPWRAIRPLDPANRNKWHDWASALGVDIAFSPLGASSLVELAAGWLNWNKDLRNKVVFRHRRIRQMTGSRSLPGAVASLKKAARLPGQLSSDAAIEAAHAAMLVKLDEFKAESQLPDRRPTPVYPKVEDRR